MAENPTNLSPFPEGFSPIPSKGELDDFLTGIRGDLNFVKHHLMVYPELGISSSGGKRVTFKDLNYDLYLLRNTVPFLVSKFEAFLEQVCKTALLSKHNLFGQFDPAISWKNIPDSGEVRPIWEAMADEALSNLVSGRLASYSNVLKKLGAPIPGRKSKIGFQLEELFLRRNVIIHNTGKPDQQYLSLVKSPRTYPSGGLYIDLDYFQRAVQLLDNTARDVVSQLIKKGVLDPSWEQVSELVKHLSEPTTGSSQG